MAHENATTAELPMPGAVLAGKYRIEHEMGRGGMAVVYAGTQLLTERRVAIKCLEPRIARSADVVERFLREARAATSIDHPNVVQVYDVGRADGLFYLVMELLAGETLRARLDRGPMPLDEALRVLVPVLGAVAAAHARGIVHRDLKPENVFLRRREDGSLRGAKVLDFGISKLSEAESLTLTGTVLGTPYYLSPEQASASEVGPPSDVYQLGTLLYEMLGGRVPFEGESYAALIAAILTTAPIPLASLRPDLPPAIGAIVGRAMARSVSDRFRDVSSFARALAPFTDVSDEALVATRAVVDAGAVDAMAPTAMFAASAPNTPATRASVYATPTIAPATPTIAPATPTIAPATPTAPPPPLRRGVVVIAIGALLAGVGTTLGIGSLLMARAPEAVPAAPARTPTIERVIVASTPTASVSVDGAAIGTTPVVVEVAPGAERVIALRAAGHAPRDLVLRSGGPPRVEVTLDPIGAAPPEAAAPPAGEPARAHAGSSEPPPARPSHPAPRAGRLTADDF